MKRAKKLIVITSTFVFMVISTNVDAECYSGGPNSTSCSYTESWGPLYSITHSVSCGSGYYACCNDEGASCIAESSSGGSPKPNVIRE